MTYFNRMRSWQKNLAALAPEHSFIDLHDIYGGGQSPLTDPEMATLAEAALDAQLAFHSDVVIDWRFYQGVQRLLREVRTRSVLTAKVETLQYGIIDRNETIEELEVDVRVRDQTIKRVRAERDHWEANHDHQVEVNRQLRDRPDLQERAAAVVALRDERDALAANLAWALDVAEIYLTPNDGWYAANRARYVDPPHPEAMG